MGDRFYLQRENLGHDYQPLKPLARAARDAGTPTFYKLLAEGKASFTINGVPVNTISTPVVKTFTTDKRKYNKKVKLEPVKEVKTYSKNVDDFFKKFLEGKIK